MLQRYRTVLGHPGAVAFSATGALARAENAMVGLGTVLLVHQATGSYAQGGAVSATIGLVSAAAAPLAARLADRFGQARVLPAVGVLHAAALVLLVLAAVPGTPFGLLLAAGVPVGATSISVGSFVRARWAALLAGGDGLQTAFALEAVVDELVFIVGPIVVTLLAALGQPAWGLLLAAALTLAGDLALARQRSTEPVLAVSRDGVHERGAVLTVRGMGVLVVVFLLIGGVFGSAEVSAAALAAAQGVPAAAGVVLGCWAAGSLIAGLLYGALRLTSRLPVRFAVLSAALAVLTAPMLTAPPVAVLAVVFFAAGFGIAPTVTAGMSLVEAILPAGRLTEGLAWTSTAIGVTYSLGAAAAGALIDAGGAASGFLLPVGCVVAAALVAAFGIRRFPRTA